MLVPGGICPYHDMHTQVSTAAQPEISKSKTLESSTYTSRTSRTSRTYAGTTWGIDDDNKSALVCSKHRQTHSRFEIPRHDPVDSSVICRQHMPLPGQAAVWLARGILVRTGSCADPPLFSPSQSRQYCVPVHEAPPQKVRLFLPRFFLDKYTQDKVKGCVVCGISGPGSFSASSTVFDMSGVCCTTPKTLEDTA